MFVRNKRIGSKDYHYLVSTSRDGGRIRQRTLAYLGESPTLLPALAHWDREIAQSERCARRLEGELADPDRRIEQSRYDWKARRRRKLLAPLEEPGRRRLA